MATGQSWHEMLLQIHSICEKGFFFIFGHKYKNKYKYKYNKKEMLGVATGQTWHEMLL